ncbi:MAG: FAD-dependent oxidoreductase [Verrucomicrobia bacterium]|nr:FAD-dependent oxidoreductase [Verrucomicrobiota bacterium]
MLKKYFIRWGLVLSAIFTCPAASAPTVIEEEYPVVILGGGIGALTSAIYLSRAGLAPVVITGPTVGGAITQSHSVQNWPGELDISGVALTEHVKYQAVHNGAILLNETVTYVDFSKRPFIITTKQLSGSNETIRKIKAQTCIVAMGATPNLLKVPGESKYWSRGMYSCAVCDGGLYKDKVVAVVGGGDSALTEAHYLSNIARKVYVVVRGDQFRSVEKERMQSILSRPNVEVLYNSEVKEVQGNEKEVTHISIQDNKNQNKQQLAVNAVFLAIGSTPNSALFKKDLELDSKGYVVLKKYQETSVEGVYAVGDIADPEFKQAITAAGDGSKAALQAQQYLTQYQPKPVTKKTSTPVSKAKPVIEIGTREELAKLLRETDGGVILDFYGDYCGPCRMFGPQYESWAKEFQGKIAFAKVNVEKENGLCEAYQIRVIPTLVILDKEGKVVRKSSGSMEIAEVGKRLDSAKDSVHIDPAIFK